ncbi:phosphonate ABC transporter ATP-binding protein [Bacillus marinisedimentorum]|uniref:phosphonate ABC transporter ATP-binding protein n=1 Tax=Bacillus marinisedimentorum TaxID=1821260 RepID=UPI0007DEDA10|nr:ATP-binding cassette domain-containing protein [Bacillus marinisedimentorum]
MRQGSAYSVDGIEKRYNGTRVIGPLSFEIRQGESVALIGPSGAGKTTLLNILSGIITPDDGVIELGGAALSSYRYGGELARKTGMMRQQFDLVGPLPVLHNVLAGRLGKWSFSKSLFSLLFPQDRKLAEEALHRVGLSGRGHEKTSGLSGGEQQRVALARLLVQNPEVILADEPVSSLDPARSESVLRLLTALASERNQTLIASLHSVELARKYFKRVIAMKDGVIQFDLQAGDVRVADLEHLYALAEGK